MTWVNARIEPGIGAMRLMIPMDFFISVGIGVPEMNKRDPVHAIAELIQDLETFAGLMPGCQGWLYDRSVEYHAAVLSVAHVDLPKRALMEPFPTVWVTKREDGTWFLQKDEDRPMGKVERV